MKKSFSLLILIFLIHAGVNGQNDSTSTPKWALSLAYNSTEGQLNQFVIDGWGRYAYSNLTNYFGDRKDRSFSISVIPQMKLRQNIILRFELGFTNINMTSYYNGIHDSLATGTNEELIKQDTLRQKMLRLIPGVQFRITHNRLLETYCGFNLSGTFYDRTKWIDHLSSNASSGYDRWVGETKGGYAVGIGAFAGFKIHVCKHLGIGTELSSGLVYYCLGGAQSGVRYYNLTIPALQVRYWNIENNLARGVQFTKPLFAILVTFNL